MTVRRVPTAVVALVATALVALAIGAAEASAAEEVGSTCVANESRPNSTAIVLDTNGLQAPQPNVIPPGVITRWRVQAPAGQAPIAQRLVVNRQVGEQDDARVGESALETIGPGTSEFATRVPAPEYAHVGLTGPEGALFCDHADMNTAGFVEGQWAIGETRHFAVGVDASVPVIAVVEPDRDNDGYGDETQDGCPQSALYQGECPRVEFDAKATALARAILVTVTPSSEATVLVWGQIAKGDRPHAVRLGRPLKKQASGGLPVQFKLVLPKIVIRRLSGLRPAESLQAKVFVHTIDLAGRPSTRRLNLRLRGRGGG